MLNFKTRALFIVKKSTNATTVHEQCMNIAALLPETSENQKKKKKENAKLQNSNAIISVQIVTMLIIINII